MSGFGYHSDEAARFPMPDEEDGVELRGKRIGYSPSGLWLDEDLEAATEEVPVVGLDDDTAPEHPAAQRAASSRPQPRFHPNGTPVWDLAPLPKADVNRGPNFWHAARNFALGSLATAVTIVGVGGFVLFSRTGGSASHGPGNTITWTGTSTPYTGNTPSPTATPKATPTTQPSPTPTPKPQPTATPQPTVTPTPNHGPYAVLATVDIPDDNIHKGDTVFATCATGSSVTLQDGHVEPRADFDPNSLNGVASCAP